MVCGGSDGSGQKRQLPWPYRQVILFVEEVVLFDAATIILQYRSTVCGYTSGH